MKYLMLDKDDITIIHGSITSKELRETMSYYQIHSMVDLGKPYLGKYLLIEDEEDNSREEVLVKKICDGARGTYYANSKGKIYIVYKSGKKKYLKPFLRRNHETYNYYVKIIDKDYTCKNLIAKLFDPNYQPGDIVLQRDGNQKNFALKNLEVISKGEHTRRTFGLTKARKVGLFENGELKQEWESATKCSKDLYCSKQTIADICNNRYRKKMYDVRWIDENNK